jgi:hypothetical protein
LQSRYAESLSIVQIKRLQFVTKMMKAAQNAAITLQKLKSASTQNITVQHVQVEAGVKRWLVMYRNKLYLTRNNAYSIRDI